MRASVRSGLFAVLGVLTWLLVLLSAGMAVSVIGSPSAMSILRLLIVVALLYPLVPLYHAIEEADTIGAVRSGFGPDGKLLVVAALVVFAVQPVEVPYLSALISLPLQRMPGMLFGATVELRPVIGGFSSWLLSFAAFYVQVLWCYLLVDAGYSLVTQGFKRER